MPFSSHDLRFEEDEDDRALEEFNPQAELHALTDRERMDWFEFADTFGHDAYNGTLFRDD